MGCYRMLCSKLQQKQTRASQGFLRICATNILEQHEQKSRRSGDITIPAVDTRTWWPRIDLLMHAANSGMLDRHPIHVLTPQRFHQRGVIMMWELLQLGCDVVAAGCSLVAALGFVAFVGWLFVSIAFIRTAANTPTTAASSPRKHIRFVSTRNLNGNLKPSIKL